MKLAVISLNQGFGLETIICVSPKHVFFWSVAKIGRVVGIATARCRGRWACEETGTTGVGGLRLHVLTAGKSR